MKSIFLPLTKVDADSHRVFLSAAVEEMDLVGEVFDYASSKPLFAKWSEKHNALSDVAVKFFGESARSFGNVREMHDKVAAGKIDEPLVFDDAAKTIGAWVKVTDPDTWEKVETGVLTGGSIGGDYANVWNDPTFKFRNRAAKRYTAEPIELSLVDSPCMPSCTFQYFKAAGETAELRKFSSVKFTSDELPGLVGKACELLADPKHAAQGHKMAATITKQATEQGFDVSGFVKAYFQQFPAASFGLKKSLYEVGDIACMLMSLNYCKQSLMYETEYEGDNSPIPAQLEDVIVSLSRILVDLALEESSELIPPKQGAAKAALSEMEKEITIVKDFLKTHSAAIEKALGSTDPEIVKMAQHLKQIGTHVDGIRKAHSKMGEHLEELDPSDDEGGESDADEKSEKAAQPNKLYKRLVSELKTEQAGIVATQKETTTQIENLTKAVKALVDNTPVASRVLVNSKAVEKANDGGEDPKPVEIDPKDPEAAFKAMKKIHADGPSKLLVKMG